MTDRIVEFGREGGYLKLKLGQLILEREKKQITSIPIEDLAAIILDHPQLIITKKALEALTENNVMVVTTNQQHLPVSLMLPLDANGLQTERLSQQIGLSLPNKKRIWQQVIKAKLLTQGKVLADITGSDAGIIALSKRVKSGDPNNLEAQGARRYWQRLFENFKREREAEDQNRYLNYGYAVLRALMCRAICATGLHPGIGVHHHNRYNAFPLADDLMEPFRPFVDMHVHQLVQEYGEKAEFEQPLRGEILKLVELRVRQGGEMQALPNAALKTAQSLLKVIQGQERHLLLPEA